MSARPSSWFVLRLFAALLLPVAVIAPIGRGDRQVVSAAGDCTVDASLDADELAFLTLINNYRAQNGLAASQGVVHAVACVGMEVERTWRRTPISRTTTSAGPGYSAYATVTMGSMRTSEKISLPATQTAQAVFDGWKASPGHNANMLGANYTAIGIGKYVRAGSQ